MGEVVVDTSVLVEHLRLGGRKSEYARMVSKTEPIVSFVTVAELYSGKSAWKEEHAREIETLLAGVEVKFAGRQRAKEAGRLRADRGLTLPDAFIAGLAVELGLPVFTLDKRDFSKVAGIKFYPVDTKRKGDSA